MTPIQALQNLYNVSRQAPLTADQHQMCTDSAKVLQDFITTKEEPKKE